MGKTIVWKIYYDDETIFSSENGTPEDAPLHGIQQITEQSQDGKSRILHNHDYYWWLGENWACGDRADLHNYLIAVHPEIKYGRTVNDSAYKRLSDLAWQEANS